MRRRAFLRLPDPSPSGSPSSSPTAPTPLEISSGLEPYTQSLDTRRARHLLRRLTFGARLADVDAIVGRPAVEVVDELIDLALDAPLPEPPPWADDAPPGRDATEEERQAYNQKNGERIVEYTYDWVHYMISSGLREKLTLFWHDHFVTEIDGYYLAPFAYRYVTLLREHALGNFKAFARAIGLNPAMLMYLDGYTNWWQAPNENYARELLELFTMGPSDAEGNANYTQKDIEEIARALTGWVVNWQELSVSFVPERFDQGPKTIFGQQDTFDYDGVIDLLFEERAPQIAEFMARKLYRAFVYDAPDEALVAELASVFLDNDFEITPVLRALFKSAHFFDEQVIGAQIKSPVDLVVGLLRELAIPVPSNQLPRLAQFVVFLEQRPLDPPNVAGWPGHHHWLSTTTLPARWVIAETTIHEGSRTEAFESTMRALHDPDDPLAVFTLPVALAEHLIPIPLDELDLNPPDIELTDTGAYPLPEEIKEAPAYVRDLTKIFLQGVLPWFEWKFNAPGAIDLIDAYVRFLAQLPEYQLT